MSQEQPFVVQTATTHDRALAVVALFSALGMVLSLALMTVLDAAAFELIAAAITGR